MAAATRILVADDEPTARLLMAAALEKAGFEVAVAVDGDDALRQFRAQPSALVMLDVDMPGRNGYELCAILRREFGDELPIVMVTAMDDNESIERAYEYGATDFIPKPINWSLIGHRVKYLLRASDALRELHAANARNAALLRAIPDLLFEVDVDGRYLSCHSSRKDLLVAPGESLIGRTIDDVLPPEAARICMAALHEANEAGLVTGRQFELMLASGAFWFELSVSRKSAEPGQKPTFVVLARNITERKAAEQKIYELAFFDSLTHLPNRQSFLERLAQDIRVAQREKQKLAVLFMDLDGFKGVNDTMGHDAGDLILQSAAERLRNSIRPGDSASRLAEDGAQVGLARLGGDEFTAVIPGITHEEDALRVANRIREQMRTPFVLAGSEVVLTSSIGIAVFPHDGADAATLLKHADTAMYHAKSCGRDNCQFYSAALTQRAQQRLTLENNLRQALERGEFDLVYQPQIDVASGRIRSVEALIRWNHPAGGVIAPQDFIPLAEENGLIVPIGEWALRTAATDAARWQDGGRVCVAVNLSPVQLRAADLVPTLVDILRETGLAPGLLELEVTEGALMEEREATHATLEALLAGGVQLALDDFGTGYSSLGYLKRVPLSNLKIDQSFVHGLPHDRENLAIVRTILALAKNLGFRTTAEGVETAEQATTLAGIGCDALQGFYFSRPLPAGAIPALLQRRWRLDETDPGGG
ncbi:Putative diguanylate cyclase/phosphodiesterase (GGDEF & EAL domains) with PAS/PAC sensor(s) and Response Regulator Receiver modulation [Thiobacillus denitrificans ATCC 25259]|uniref:Putative diguanylate cyclase/phosphodiesterase (GGDEF & EAL domains) with PAS/PAC sensor(S) and Response Regulator Receiver modulation n=1 Tax=Thiobacillus denitrificans (strain ATCC 25259 / T1) TaxID=292415 RepID=Q3SJE2_THIDA|nr:EAL domain-containing protein [Thiobacillus denitrificans]AAZ97222.1 Putative diguanylate cyclase/phosphodiesterase (GGDEF & EAL domains) with PAS/PAC sensor(s) and Response Regulator Receiver modulation [Thiobacillus denitrificans ATCC 25259]